MYSEVDDFKEKEHVFNKMLKVLKSHDKDLESLVCLEVGGSGGILSGLLSPHSAKVTCTDIVNVQSSYDGQFPYLLKEKFLRNGFKLDLNKIEFHTVDAQDLIYKDNTFDFIFSLNAFEHIPEPARALVEVHRVLKKGGVFYTSFDPIWTTDTGSHFFNYVPIPWEHLISDDEEFIKKMDIAGASLNDKNEYIQAMNRLPADYYLNDFQELLDQLFPVVNIEHWKGCVSDEHCSHDNLTKAAAILNCNSEDLLIRGFEVVAIK